MAKLPIIHKYRGVSLLVREPDSKRKLYRMTKRINILVALVLLLTGARASVAKPTIAVLPFAVAKERGSLQWLSYATASTLTEKMRRIPSIRVIPVEDVV